MKRHCQIAKALLLIITAILGSRALAQSGRVNSDSSPHQGSVKLKDGFVDFTLKRINPSKTDYGQCLAESRTMLFEGTIRNAYFWSNIVSLCLLACLFFIVLYQNKIQAKRELAMAEMVRQFEQNLTRSRVHIAEATKKNRELADALAVLKEPSSPASSLPLESADNALTITTKSRTPTTSTASTVPAKTNSAKAQNGTAAEPVTVREKIGQMRLFTPDADFVMKLNSLEQQLAQSREDNKQLRRRIANGDRKLEAEQERSRQLKNA